MNEKPNVLLVVPRLNIGGAESYVVTLSKGLVKRGYQVVVASWGGHLVQTLADVGVRHIYVPIRFNAKLAGVLLRHIIKKCQIDLVHANSAAAGYACLKACEHTSIPLIYTAHGVLGHDKREFAFNKADKIICVSDFLRRLSIERGFREDRLITIYNGIELNRFQISPQLRINSRRQLNMDEHDFVVGIVSRIKNLHDKGHEDLIEIFRRYPAARNWRLLIVGKGKGLWKLRYKVWRLGLKKQVCFAGFQADVPQMMAAMDTLVLPSNFETFGLVLAEANAMGKPVVAYDAGGIPEAVADGETGFIVPKGNIEGLYEKIKRLDDNRDLAQQLGNNGKLRVQKMFQSEQMIDQVTALYHQVLVKHLRNEQGAENV